MPDRKRPAIIAANWKMYKTIEEGISFIKELSSRVSDLNNNVRVLIAVPFTALEKAAVQAKDTPLEIGAQNMHDADQGAFTGEIAAEMLVEAGARFVLLGHSERRHVFNESSSFINSKVKKALQTKLCPVVCVGETLEEREAGKSKETVTAQLEETLEGIAPQKGDALIFAYEPVWAIGTGKTATAEQAQEMHGMIRGWLKDKWGQEAADSLAILYGGSVKPDNVKELLEQPDVDGVLVGGASLYVDSFNKIIHYQNVGSPS